MAGSELEEHDPGWLLGAFGDILVRANPLGCTNPDRLRATPGLPLDVLNEPGGIAAVEDGGGLGVSVTLLVAAPRASENRYLRREGRRYGQDTEANKRSDPGEASRAMDLHGLRLSVGPASAHVDRVAGCVRGLPSGTGEGESVWRADEGLDRCPCRAVSKGPKPQRPTVAQLLADRSREVGASGLFLTRYYSHTEFLKQCMRGELGGCESRMVASLFQTETLPSATWMRQRAVVSVRPAPATLHNRACVDIRALVWSRRLGTPITWR
jgi:hypothetical protein